MSIKSLLLSGVIALPMIGVLPVQTPAEMTRIADWLPQAHAAFIRRASIKKKPVSGYRVATVIDTTDGTIAASVTQQVRVRTEDGGTIAYPETTLNRDRQSQFVFGETIYVETRTISVCTRDGDALTCTKGEAFLGKTVFGSTSEIETPRGIVRVSIGEPTDKGTRIRLSGKPEVIESAFPEGDDLSGIYVNGERVASQRSQARWAANLTFIEDGALDGQTFDVTTTVRDEKGGIIEQETRRQYGDFEDGAGDRPGVSIDRVRLRANKKGAVISSVDTTEVLENNGTTTATITADYTLTYADASDQRVVPPATTPKPVATSHVYFDPIPFSGDKPPAPGGEFVSLLEIYSQTGAFLDVSETVLTIDGDMQAVRGAFGTEECQFDRAVQAVTDDNGMPRLDVVLTAKGKGCGTPDLTPGTVKVDNNGVKELADILKDDYGIEPKTAWTRNRFRTPNGQSELVESGDMEINVTLTTDKGETVDRYSYFGPGDLQLNRAPEPYRGKGIRYVGEQIRRKAGKAAAK